MYTSRDPQAPCCFRSLCRQSLDQGWGRSVPARDTRLRFPPGDVAGKHEPGPTGPILF